MRFGQVADFLVVIYEGSCSIKIRNLTIMQRKAPDLIGENALFSNQQRSADVQADNEVKAIILYRSTYESALKDFENEQ